MGILNHTTRTRLAAVGAVLAVTLGAGGVGLVRAATSTDAPGLTPITACRLVDTRPDFQVGPRGTPLGPADTYTVAAHGEQGQCNIPTQATALALNVTAVDATLDTFLTLWDDGELPNASSLNPSPGQPPTPNAVTVPLTDTGTFNIYNFQGNVHVVIDIVGYHQPHDHDDRYYTKGQSDDRYYTKSEADDRYSTDTTGAEADMTFVKNSNSDGVVASVTVDTSTYGYVVVDAHAQAQNLFLVDGGYVECSITSGNSLDNDHLITSSRLDSNTYESINGSRAFRIGTIPLTGERTYDLACEYTTANLANVHLNAVFVPDSDARSVVVPVLPGLGDSE